MKIFGFYISRTDWELRYYNVKEFKNHLLRELDGKKETYTGKDGRLRFKHNGQFAPDNRSKFKQIHDQLRAEVKTDWNALKQASRIEGFGR